MWGQSGNGWGQPPQRPMGGDGNGFGWGGWLRGMARGLAQQRMPMGGGGTPQEGAMRDFNHSLAQQRTANEGGMRDFNRGFAQQQMGNEGAMRDFNNSRAPTGMGGPMGEGMVRPMVRPMGGGGPGIVREDDPRFSGMRR